MKTINDLKQYDTFRYKKYQIMYLENSIKVTYFFSIDNLTDFQTELEIPCKNDHLDQNYVSILAFNIGLVESISYWKCTCPHNYIIECGHIDSKQEQFFKKLFYYGLGEFFYINKLNVSFDNFISFQNTQTQLVLPKIAYQGSGNIIGVGGGKDSCVTLALLQNEPSNEVFIINPKNVMHECAKIAGYDDQQIINIKRRLDPQIIELNKQGFLNGHTPFSAMVAFVSYLTAYLNNKKNVILSNESSANETNVKGLKVNHQYSKSFEFENDFRNYQKEYLGDIINYFSLLRPLSEYQIGMLFAKYTQFHNVFKSCNVGSKKEPWHWCGNCAKCLFVYSLLSPHLSKKDLVNIFNKDLFADPNLLETFQELLGYLNVKPFDCVGTFAEINYAIYQTINKADKTQLPFLLQYYYEHYYKDLSSLNLEKYWNTEHNLDAKYEQIVKDAIYD